MLIPQTLPSASPRGLVCPACSQALERRQRYFSDRVLARLLALFTDPTHPPRRYACTSGACGWQGLLRGRLPRRPGYLPNQWL
jgi:hypothetical protein